MLDEHQIDCLLKLLLFVAAVIIVQRVFINKEMVHGGHQEGTNKVAAMINGAVGGAISGMAGQLVNGIGGQVLGGALSSVMGGLFLL